MTKLNDLKDKLIEHAVRLEHAVPLDVVRKLVSLSDDIGNIAAYSTQDMQGSSQFRERQSLAVEAAIDDCAEIQSFIKDEQVIEDLRALETALARSVGAEVAVEQSLSPEEVGRQLGQLFAASPNPAISRELKDAYQTLINDDVPESIKNVRQEYINDAIFTVDGAYESLAEQLEGDLDEFLQKVIQTAPEVAQPQQPQAAVNEPESSIDPKTPEGKLLQDLQVYHQQLIENHAQLSNRAAAGRRGKANRSKQDVAARIMTALKAGVAVDHLDTWHADDIAKDKTIAVIIDDVKNAQQQKPKRPRSFHAGDTREKMDVPRRRAGSVQVTRRIRGMSLSDRLAARRQSRIDKKLQRQPFSTLREDIQSKSPPDTVKLEADKNFYDDIEEYRQKLSNRLKAETPDTKRAKTLQARIDQLEDMQSALESGKSLGNPQHHSEFTSTIANIDKTKSVLSRLSGKKDAVSSAWLKDRMASHSRHAEVQSLRSRFEQGEIIDKQLFKLIATGGNYSEQLNGEIDALYKDVVKAHTNMQWNAAAQLMNSFDPNDIFDSPAAFLEGNGKTKDLLRQLNKSGMGYAHMVLNECETSGERLVAMQMMIDLCYASYETGNLLSTCVLFGSFVNHNIQRLEPLLGQLNSDPEIKKKLDKLREVTDGSRSYKAVRAAQKQFDHQKNMLGTYFNSDITFTHEGNPTNNIKKAGLLVSLAKRLQENGDITTIDTPYNFTDFQKRSAGQDQRSLDARSEKILPKKRRNQEGYAAAVTSITAELKSQAASRVSVVADPVDDAVYKQEINQIQSPPITAKIDEIVAGIVASDHKIESVEFFDHLVNFHEEHGAEATAQHLHDIVVAIATDPRAEHDSNAQDIVARAVKMQNKGKQRLIRFEDSAREYVQALLDNRSDRLGITRVNISLKAPNMLEQKLDSVADECTALLAEFDSHLAALPESRVQPTADALVPESTQDVLQRIDDALAFVDNIESLPDADMPKSSNVDSLVKKFESIKEQHREVHQKDDLQHEGPSTPRPGQT